MKKIILLLLVLVVGFPVVLAETTSAYASQEQKIYCTATIDDEFADNGCLPSRNACFLQ